MKAIIVTRPGGPEVLELQDLPVPEPKPGEVLIKVAAAGVNAPDLAQRRGSYSPPPGASPLLGLEVAGTLPGGQAVVALTNGGGYAEYVAVPAGQVLPLPGGYSMFAGAALPETFFTVMQTLVMRAALEPGMHVLVHGAAGGLGGAAILIATALGARAIAVVSSEEKAAYALSLGAVAAIDHTREDIVARTRELTGGNGAERVLDMAGGAVTAQNLDAVRRYGHIVLVATQGGGDATLPLNKLVARQLTLSGSTLRPQPPETKAGIAAKLGELIWPNLAAMPKQRLRTFPLADAADAHRALEDRRHIGKIVLSIS
jgi:NADPH2:quinone reductase